MLKQNRRKYPRLLFKAKVEVSIAGRKLSSSICENISVGGMCLIVNDFLPEDVYGNVVLEKKIGKTLITFESKFLRLWDKLVKPGKSSRYIGVKFLEMNEKNASALSTLISNLSA
ncbi:MAG: PilZ domain-containing protein [Fibrobacteria bacterium]|nr:PilZ domain-containing protein [Fibrobacteria bacterium]